VSLSMVSVAIRSASSHRTAAVLRRHRFPEHGLVVAACRRCSAADRRQHGGVAIRAGTFLEPLNIRCSKRWREPGAARLLVLRPDVIHELQSATIGVEWSSDSTTVSPFGNVVIWYCSFGGREAADDGRVAVSITAGSHQRCGE